MYRWFATTGVLALMFSVGACSSPSETTEPTAATVTVTTTAEAAAPATVTETATATVTMTATAEPTTTSEPEPTDDDVSEGSAGSVTDGALDYTLLEVTYPESIEAFGDREDPEGQFVLVMLNVANNGDDAVDFTGWDQQLIDDQGRTHDTADAGDYLDKAFTYDTINPGLSQDGSLVFDIPADSTAEALLLSSDIFGDDPVQLPLSE